MCLILFAINQHPEFPLILIANRDEYHARPSKPLHWWSTTPQLLGGQDLESCGSWLALNRQGKLAAITNFREAGANQLQRPSRGHLVRDYLLGAHNNWHPWLEQNAQSYNGFNLLYGRWDQLCWRSNRYPATRRLEPAIYGLSNHLLDTPWPKVERGKQLLQQSIHQQNLSLDNLLAILQNDQPVKQNQLPDTGIGLQWEQRLAPIFIRSEHYGTRASTVLLVDRQHHIQVKERSWNQNGSFSDRYQQFDIEP